MGILLVGCVGVANGVSAWLDGKRTNIAILKSLGARPPLILRIYLAQVIGAAAAGVALGLAGEPRHSPSSRRRWANGCRSRAACAPGRC